MTIQIGIRGSLVGFLIDIFWALLLVGAPIAVFTMALVWWSLQGGHFKESSDTSALMAEIKAMRGKKEKKEKKARKARKEDKAEKKAEKKARLEKMHPLQRKWAKFGGGFYGIVAFFTYIVIEVIEIITTISNLGGFIDFIKKLNFSLVVEMFVQAIMNFVNAMIWPVYWMQRIDTNQVWAWFLIAYGGYWVGLKLAQALIQRRSHVVT